MLALAELAALGAGQDQRKEFGEIRSREGADERLLEVRQRRGAGIKEGFGIELDFARRRSKPIGDAISRLGVFLIVRLQWHAYSTGILAQGVERNAGGAKLVAVGGFDIAVPKVVAETEPTGQIEDDLRVGTSFAPGCDHWLSQLNE